MCGESAIHLRSYLSPVTDTAHSLCIATVQHKVKGVVVTILVRYMYEYKHLAVLQPGSDGHEEAAGLDFIRQWMGTLLLRCRENEADAEGQYYHSVDF
jgi:hypothetical protein